MGRYIVMELPCFGVRRMYEVNVLAILRNVIKQVQVQIWFNSDELSLGELSSSELS